MKQKRRASAIRPYAEKDVYKCINMHVKQLTFVMRDNSHTVDSVLARYHLVGIVEKVGERATRKYELINMLEINLYRFMYLYYRYKYI